ncbi:MAG: bifunctional phosphoserine phosphatase/homoserine phosphotransferase ThrH [Verrucomicrobiota bacterium]|nr:bifunctional phosphoserine phosphatase/homoserine phosphotransferase ThrH [Verrucomicrobiota bacterium]|tara:strand:- start:1086 stop:1700 length:615 start_codon:yes stop_codon:yes gene_type:complete
MKQQTIVTLDLEGVLVPEIWIAFAEKTGIEELKLTTRDIPDYDELMAGRLSLLNKNSLKLTDIQEVIRTLSPLEGAKAFLDELRSTTQVVILSDTFKEFASPLMEQLDWPTIFCHDLEVDLEGRVINYRLRQSDQKRKSVAAFRGLNYYVIAAGDSYNDTTMLCEADKGFLFRSPDNVKKEFPQFQSAEEYRELMEMIRLELER